MNPAHGGPCQGIRNSVPALRALGIDNEVVCMDNPDAGFLHQDDFTIHAVGESNGLWARNTHLYDWLINHLMAYDVVIVHGFWQYHVYAVRKAMQKLKRNPKHKIPKVYAMPHGMLDPYFQKAEGRKLKALRNDIYWKFIESKNVESFDGLLFTCEEELRLAATAFKPYKPKSTLNVSYGVKSPSPTNEDKDSEFFKQFKALQPGNYLLFLSRVHPKKGVDILIQAYQTVFAHKSDAPVLAIAGPGMDTEYGASLKHLVENSEFLKSKVLFLGMLQGDLKWSAFHNCQAFVLPSHQENFGIAVAEALACKRPVIISNKVNIYFEIEKSNAGIICNDDVNGVKMVLEKWNRMSEDDKKQMSVKAYDLYLSAFTNEAAAARLTEVLNHELQTQQC